jgi:hypothetical protein
MTDTSKRLPLPTEIPRAGNSILDSGHGPIDPVVAAERLLLEDEAFLLENSASVSAEGIEMRLRLITPDNPIYRFAVYK